MIPHCQQHHYIVRIDNNNNNSSRLEEEDEQQQPMMITRRRMWCAYAGICFMALLFPMIVISILHVDIYSRDYACEMMSDPMSYNSGGCVCSYDAKWYEPTSEVWYYDNVCHQSQSSLCVNGSINHKMHCVVHIKAHRILKAYEEEEVSYSSSENLWHYSDPKVERFLTSIILLMFMLVYVCTIQVIFMNQFIY